MWYVFNKQYKKINVHKIEYNISPEITIKLNASSGVFNTKTLNMFL